MGKRRFLLLFVVSFAASMACVALMNALIDPYMLFDAPRISGINAIKPRPEVWSGEIKRAVAVRQRPEAFILGNSRAEIGFDPEHASLRRLKLDTYNLAVPGMGLGGNIAMLLQIARNQRPQLLLVGAEFIDFLGSTDSRAIELRHREGGEWAAALLRIKALLTLKATQDSIGTLLLQHTAYPATLTPSGFNPLLDYREIAAHEGYHVMFRQRAEQNAKTLAQKAAKLPPDYLERGELARLQELLQEAARWNGEMHIIIYPYHAQLLLMFQELGLWPAFEEFKRRLVAEARAAQTKSARVSVWDFSGYSLYAAQPIPPKGKRGALSPWYWEAGHFKKELGDIMLARILDDEAPALDPRFGVRIDTGNIENHLQAQRLELVSLRKHKPLLESEVRRLVRAVSNH